MVALMEEPMHQLRVPSGKSVHIEATRPRAEQSGFQLYFYDKTTDGVWSPLGPRMFVEQTNEHGWSAILAGDPRLKRKPYNWDLGIDQVTISGGTGSIAETVECDRHDNKTTIHIFDGVPENTTIVFSFIGAHGATTATLVDQAKGNAAYEAAIKDDLARPDVAEAGKATSKWGYDV